jgi:hypothetical protein
VANTLGTVVGATTTEVGTTLSTPLVNPVGNTLNSVGGSLPVLGNGLTGVLR